MTIDLDKYLDVRWTKGGREFPLLDCYGVVNEVRGDLGLEAWPDYAGATREELPELAAACDKPGSDKSEGAVAFCYEGGLVTHVAVLVTVQGRMCALECNEHHDVTVMPLHRFERRFVRVEYRA